MPKRDEKPVMGLKSNKNFIHTNAVENIMSVAKKPQPKYVDTPGGTTNNLEVWHFDSLSVKMVYALVSELCLLVIFCSYFLS